MVKEYLDKILTKEILEQYYNQFGSLKEVGRQLNISADSVKKYMIRYNLTFKPKVIYNCNHNFFSDDNEYSFYIARFIAADGCVKYKKNLKSGNIYYELNICLSKQDKLFLESIKQIMKIENPIKDYIVKNSKYNQNWKDSYKSELKITSKQICEDLLRFNIIPRKSLIYTFPEWLKIHPMKHHFIRGYNDGDGSFYRNLGKNKKTSQLYFSMRGTINFLEDIEQILSTECQINRKKIRISSNFGCLEYGGNNLVNKIKQYLYKDATIYLPRKYLV